MDNSRNNLVSKPQKLRGIVQEFNTTTRRGVISAGDQLYKICRADIEQEASMLPVNSLVRFQLAIMNDQPHAVKVKTLRPRFKGKIKVLKKYSGIIESSQGIEYFFNFNEVIIQQRKLRINDPVEFRMKKNHIGDVACEIICDNDYLFNKFCSYRPENFYTLLAEMAAPENWDYVNMETDPFPLLKSYIRHTFENALQQNVIGYTYRPETSAAHAYFNTGLLTANGEELYVSFYKSCKPHESQRSRDWNFEKFTTDINIALLQCERTPLAPRYYFNPGEITFNQNAPIHYSAELMARNYIHLLPVSFLTNSPDKLILLVSNALQQSISQYQQQLVMPVAKYYFNKIEFAIPLFINGKITAAMVLKWYYDRYSVTALVPLDNAYKCARMLGPVTEPWLKPVCSFERVDWMPASVGV